MIYVALVGTIIDLWLRLNSIDDYIILKIFEIEMKSEWYDIVKVSIEVVRIKA